MKIPRIYARLCILFMIIGLALLIVGIIIPSKLIFILASICIAIAVIVKFLLLKCPYCHWSGLSPQWSKSGTMFCVKCGKPIEYDDSN